MGMEASRGLSSIHFPSPLSEGTGGVWGSGFVGFWFNTGFTFQNAAALS